MSENEVADGITDEEFERLLAELPEELVQKFKDAPDALSQIEAIANFDGDHLKKEALGWARLRMLEFHLLTAVMGEPPPDLKDDIMESMNRLEAVEKKLAAYGESQQPVDPEGAPAN